MIFKICNKFPGSGRILNNTAVAQKVVSYCGTQILPPEFSWHACSQFVQFTRANEMTRRSHVAQAVDEEIHSIKPENKMAANIHIL